jgi:hypothetical protein
MIFCKLLVFISLLAKMSKSNNDKNDDCLEDVKRIKRQINVIKDKTFKKLEVYNNGVTEITTQSWPR